MVGWLWLRRQSWLGALWIRSRAPPVCMSKCPIARSQTPNRSWCFNSVRVCVLMPLNRKSAVRMCVWMAECDMQCKALWAFNETREVLCESRPFTVHHSRFSKCGLEMNMLKYKLGCGHTTACNSNSYKLNYITLCCDVTHCEYIRADVDISFQSYRSQHFIGWKRVDKPFLNHDEPCKANADRVKCLGANLCHEISLF